jgi:hypothetical protein
MRTANIHLTSTTGSELFFGKMVMDKKQSKETHEQHEERTWKNKVHTDKNGNVFIQPFALKNGLESAARWISMPIPGEGKKTFTKRFTAGTLVVDRIYLKDHDGKQITIDEVDVKWLPVPSDGKRGSGKRVVRGFPYVTEWQADCSIIIMDDKIDEDVLAEHLETMGMFIGFGSMRVENGGTNGRFTVDSLKLE